MSRRSTARTCGTCSCRVAITTRPDRSSGWRWSSRAGAAGTVVTLLPGVEFCTRQPYPDVRRYLDAGVTVALASDCNPGSCFTSSVPFCIAVAVRDMHFTVEQAIWSATAGGAAALDRTDVGRLSVGARADFSILDAPSARHLAYRPGVNLVAEVYRDGVPFAHNFPKGSR